MDFHLAQRGNGKVRIDNTNKKRVAIVESARASEGIRTKSCDSKK